MSALVAFLMMCPVEVERLLLKHAPDAPIGLVDAICEESRLAGINYETVVRIVIIESRGRPYAFNKKSRDYGVMQINYYTARSMGLSKECLWDWRCNLHAGVSILASTRRVCYYNLGPKFLNEVRMRACKRYEDKVASIK